MSNLKISGLALMVFSFAAMEANAFPFKKKFCHRLAKPVSESNFEIPTPIIPTPAVDETVKDDGGNTEEATIPAPTMQEKKMWDELLAKGYVAAADHEILWEKVSPKGRKDFYDGIMKTEKEAEKKANEAEKKKAEEEAKKEKKEGV